MRFTVRNSRFHIPFKAVLAGLLFAVALPLRAIAPPSNNIAPNPSFEVTQDDESRFPRLWQKFHSHRDTIETVQGDARSGKFSVALRAQGEEGAFEGIIFSVPAREGETFEFSAFIKNDRMRPLENGTEGVLAIEWRNDRDVEIYRSTSTYWDHTTARLRWTRFAVPTAAAPLGASKAVLGIHLIEEDGPGRGGFLVDDITVVRTAAP